KRVVVVDDDPQVGRAISRLLKSAHCEVTEFDSAESLLEARSLPPADGYIFDIQLSGMSGLDLAARVRADGARGAIVFITGRDDPLARERADELGATGFLVKPFESETLLALLMAETPADSP